VGKRLTANVEEAALALVAIERTPPVITGAAALTGYLYFCRLSPPKSRNWHLLPSKQNPCNYSGNSTNGRPCIFQTENRIGTCCRRIESPCNYSGPQRFWLSLSLRCASSTTACFAHSCYPGVNFRARIEYQHHPRLGLAGPASAYPRFRFPDGRVSLGSYTMDCHDRAAGRQALGGFSALRRARCHLMMIALTLFLPLERIVQSLSRYYQYVLVASISSTTKARSVTMSFPR